MERQIVAHKALKICLILTNAMSYASILQQGSFLLGRARTNVAPEKDEERMSASRSDGTVPSVLWIQGEASTVWIWDK